MEEAQEAAAAGDLARGRALMEQAAATGEPEALNGLASFVALGIGGDPDPQRGRELLEEALAAGSIGAKLNLGTELIDSDESGDQRRGVALLSELYANPPDDAGREAVRAVAAGGLAKAYIFGLGVEEDVGRGVDLLEEADIGDGVDAGVLFLLGRTFESGSGGRERDAKRSFGYFLRAAELDHPASQWRVGMALLNGSGVGRDAPQAYRWVRRAAEAGNTDAEISTAVMLALGQGVEENDPEARIWYERATRKNSAHALRGLGSMLIHGEGGPPDVARGFAYLKLAADAGEEGALELLPQVETQVSGEDRAAAEDIAAAWLRQHGAPDAD